MKAQTRTTIGIDLGDRKHSICVLDSRGQVQKEEVITNSRESLNALSRRHPGALVVMEVVLWAGIGGCDGGFFFMDIEVDVGFQGNVPI